MHKRIAIILAFIAAYVAISLPFTLSLFAKSKAQATLPDFTLNAQTVISVTVAITDGLVIVIPVDLNFVAENNDGETDLSLITDVDQQAGIFIGVVPADAISATIRLPQAPGSNSSNASSDATPTSPSEVNSEGTHVANRNANLRAGPGTNFAIVGNVRSGNAVTVVGQNNDGTWLELDNGNWIAAFLVDPIEDNDEEDNEVNVETEEANQEEETDEETDEVTLATYLDDIADISAQTLGAVDALSDLVQAPQPQNSNWRIDLSTQVDILTNALDQYLDLSPIAGYEDLHTQVTEVTLACEDALGSVVTALQNPPTIDTELANESVQACGVGASNLADAVQELQ